MTHFGILCPPSTVHLKTMIPLGSELLRRGHRVTVFNLLDTKTTTLASGLEFQPLAEDEFPAGSMAEGLTQLGKLSPVPFPFAQLTGKPLIYASMGTVQNRLLDVFQTIASACEGLDAQLVISLGAGASSKSLPPLPGNRMFVGYAPQL
jgi:UDP:flavonoid glycosyltransferase YjiC (YdhE family)